MHRVGILDELGRERVRSGDKVHVLVRAVSLDTVEDAGGEVCSLHGGDPPVDVIQALATKMSAAFQAVLVLCGGGGGGGGGQGSCVWEKRAQNKR